jgi:NAD(P)H-hydrate epimerase
VPNDAPLSLSRAELVELDRLATAELGLPSALLMENAGRGAAERVLEVLGQRGARPGRVAIVCGPGNNGGDGYAAARHVALAGCEVDLCTLVEPSSLRGDAAMQHAVASRLGLSIARAIDPRELAACAERWKRADVLVDALLGTGATPPPRPHAAAAIEAFNAREGPAKVALDLPSGMDADTGATPGACIRADLTVTFAALKLGFASATARPFLGRVVVASIGVPAALVRARK